MLSLTTIFALTLIQYIHKTAFVSARFSPHSFRVILKVFFQMHKLPEKTLGHQKISQFHGDLYLYLTAK